jgi:hypothetical protein
VLKGHKPVQVFAVISIVILCCELLQACGIFLMKKVNLPKAWLSSNVFKMAAFFAIADNSFVPHCRVREYICEPSARIGTEEALVYGAGAADGGAEGEYTGTGNEIRRKGR